MERLPLEEALENSPRIRSLAHVFEEDAKQLKFYTNKLFSGYQRILNAQNQMVAAIQGLSKDIADYEKQNFPLDKGNEDIKSIFRQFSSHLDDLGSVQQILAAQLADNAVHPVSKFIQTDLEEVSTMLEMCDIASQEHEHSMNRYSRLHKKRDSDRQKAETAEELAVMRRKFHQTTLHYYSSLNSLQYKRRIALLSPVLGYMQSLKSFFQVGNDLESGEGVTTFTGTLSETVASVQKQQSEATRSTGELLDTLEACAGSLYWPEPSTETRPPDTALKQKAGYLYHRTKEHVLATPKWERLFFFTQGGNLMSQGQDEVAGRLCADLNEDAGVKCEPADYDDRRFTFHIALPASKRHVVLQAENEIERLEWIHTIHNIVTRGGYIKDGSNVARRKQTSSESQAFTKSQPRSRSTTEPLMMPLFLPDTPIQFDIISPTDEQRDYTPKEGPPQRVNPFDESASDVLSKEVSESLGGEHNYIVRFLGCMQVLRDRGQPLVHEIIRQVMTARAMYNIFKSVESQLLVSVDGVKLLDPGTRSARVTFRLENISFWAAHKDNEKLFALVIRDKSDSSHPTFSCYVFESEVSGNEICEALAKTTSTAYQQFIEKRTTDAKQEKEKALLLANIGQLSDCSSGPQLSSDGKYLLLEPADGPVYQAPAFSSDACQPLDCDLQQDESEA